MVHLQTHTNDVDPQVKATHTATDLILLDVEPMPPCSDIPLARLLSSLHLETTIPTVMGTLAI